MCMLTSARCRIVRIPNVEIGSKIMKQLCRVTFCHDVSKLVSGWHMKHPNMTKRHLFANKMNVNLDMSGVAVLN